MPNNEADAFSLKSQNQESFEKKRAHSRPSCYEDMHHTYSQTMFSSGHNFRRSCVITLVFLGLFAISEFVSFQICNVFLIK